jgi:hypothetical protein
MESSLVMDPEGILYQRNPIALPDDPCPLVRKRPSHGTTPIALPDGPCPLAGRWPTHGTPGSPATEVERDPECQSNCDQRAKQSYGTPNLHLHDVEAGGRGGALENVTADGCAQQHHLLRLQHAGGLHQHAVSVCAAACHGTGGRQSACPFVDVLAPVTPRHAIITTIIIMIHHSGPCQAASDMPDHVVGLSIVLPANRR